MAYDIIGDIHGHADRLEALLAHLGYQRTAGAWRHASRTAIFVGDLIDRGPGQLRTLQVVRDMLACGSAEAVMGNHEFNAIGWATGDPVNSGHHLRPRLGKKGEKNRRQHEAFLAEVGPDSADHRWWADWFMDFPLWIEKADFRVVHACWDPGSVATLSPLLRDGAKLDTALVEAAHRAGDPVRDAIEVVLKGAEIEIPEGSTFTDKDGNVRGEIRTRWWDPTLSTYRATYIGPDGIDLPDTPLPDRAVIAEPDRPTFIGHYWLDPRQPPAPLTTRVACVDYSAGRSGPLAAYRFDGEQVLVAANFVAV